MTEHRARLRPEQRRRLEVVLNRALSLAREFEALGRHSAPVGFPLEPMVDDLPPGFAGRAPALAVRIREAAAPLLDWLEIAPAPRSLRQHLAAATLVAAIDVEDSDSRSLQHYGALDEADARRIDPVVSELRQLLYDIAAQVSGDRPEPMEGHPDARIQG